MNRKTILQRIIDERYGGSQAEFARAIKRAPAQVNQWIKGLRQIGDASVHNIEMRLSLGLNGFDNYPRQTVATRGTECAEPPPTPYKYGHLMEDFALLLDEDQQRLAGEIKRLADIARTYRARFGGCVVDDARIKEVLPPVPIAERRKN